MFNADDYVNRFKDLIFLDRENHCLSQETDLSVCGF